MSFEGYFQPRGLKIERRTRQSLRHGRVQCTADSQLFRSELLVEGHPALAADVRCNEGGADLGSHLFAGDDRIADLDRLAAFDGDFAFALIDDREPQLILGLAPLSELELHYRVAADGGVSFATNLLSLLADGEQPDVGLLGKSLQFMAFFDEEEGFYQDVRQVQPGCVVIFRNGRREVRRFWGLAPPQADDVAERTAAEQLRAALERAVGSRLAALPGAKASLLSAGRDSSAVMAVAATLLQDADERLGAWTAGALPGVENDRGRLLDEGPIAAITASRFRNVDHHVVPPAQIDLCRRLDEIHRSVAVPIVQPLAVAWCETIWNASESKGNRLLLSGDFGNYALSAGGLAYLEDVRLESGVWPWLASGAAIARAAPLRLRPLAGAMLGHRWQARRNGGQPPIVPFLRGALRESWQDNAGDVSGDARSYRQWLRNGIRISIGPNDVVRLGRRLEMTDPTRDRRLVELVHSLPARMLAGPADRRRIFDRAFGDLLPRQVLRPQARGRQNVDWHYNYRPDELRRGLARYAQSRIVRGMIDCQALAAALDRWPDTRTLSGPVFEQMVWGVLPALSMASFLASRGD
jgi:asparagine synthetase B (glutamine-hydrolysing)